MPGPLPGRHIASFSSGLSSALMVERLIARYRDQVTIVFMDTLIEDDDNYRFMNEIRRKRWQGIEFVVLREGRSPYQVGEDKSIIPNQSVAPCTSKLKIRPFLKYLKSLPKPFTIHIGFDFSEIHRCAATDRNYGELGYTVDYPLLWEPLEHREYVAICRDSWGIEPPRMYAMGYTHANCGGLCVKQGQGDWIRTLINFPERYAEAEAWEAQMRAKPKTAPYSLVRRVRKGIRSSVTLKELREEYQSKQSLPLPMLDEESGCVVCGAGEINAEDASSE